MKPFPEFHTDISIMFYALMQQHSPSWSFVTQNSDNFILGLECVTYYNPNIQTKFIRENQYENKLPDELEKAFEWKKRLLKSTERNVTSTNQPVSYC